MCYNGLHTSKATVATTAKLIKFFDFLNVALQFFDNLTRYSKIYAGARLRGISRPTETPFTTAFITH